MNTVRNGFYFLTAASTAALIVIGIGLSFALLVLPLTLIPSVTHMLGLATIPATIAYYGAYYLLAKNVKLKRRTAKNQYA